MLVASWRVKLNVSLSTFAPGNLVSRDGFDLSAPACSFSILRVNLMLTYGIPPEFHGGVHLLIPPAPSGLSRVNQVTQLLFHDGVSCRGWYRARSLRFCSFAGHTMHQY